MPEIVINKSFCYETTLKGDYLELNCWMKPLRGPSFEQPEILISQNFFAQNRKKWLNCCATKNKASRMKLPRALLSYSTQGKELFRKLLYLTLLILFRTGLISWKIWSCITSVFVIWNKKWTKRYLIPQICHCLHLQKPFSQNWNYYDEHD